MPVVNSYMRTFHKCTSNLISPMSAPFDKGEGPALQLVDGPSQRRCVRLPKLPSLRAMGVRIIAPAMKGEQPLTRSENMSRIRSKDTRAEARVRSAVRRLGIRYRIHVPGLPGIPDLANRRRKWAIFVHGCFWHCHEGCKRFVLPKTRTHYWIPKLRGNAERDARNVALLQAMGLRVLIIWECETNDPCALESLVRPFFANGPLPSGGSVILRKADRREKPRFAKRLRHG
jgi:DNA mismatch endonuclease, patch repair protein